ncbi:hypothetical protein CK203_072966 [Vitis vinifera]|uniref:Uncharacterized protein n=1 Tax=Vitis vinifera TaxID=29760 RepID=A0A438F210_VITVI|nr:hypothetical protein CK203_072966 [Vitis vinifera]
MVSLSTLLECPDKTLATILYKLVSCIEHLCDSLCYQLDLASFVACVNSGQSWNSKSSLLLSGRETMAIGEEDNQFDPFVENFVLERLSVQSSLRAYPLGHCDVWDSIEERFKRKLST